ncbi:IS66 family insertion sequence element accessory protein TnpB [Streptococcus merionis]
MSSSVIRFNNLGLVYLVCGKTDMRQGIDSLAYLIKSQFNLDPSQVSSSSSVAGAKTASKLFTGMVKISSCSTNALKMAK